MEINDGHQRNSMSGGRFIGTSYREEGEEHMYYAMGECISSHRRIYGCSSDGYVVVRVWGIDKRGHQINAVITCATDRIARHAAAAALEELGARAHVWIAPMKDEDTASG